MGSILYYINKLQATIFSIYLKRDYLDKHFFYEKKIHEISLKIFSKILQKKDNNYDKLLEIITALGNLRYRISDHATFGVCEQELSNITNNISSLLIKNKKNFADLAKSIEAFEIIFSNTLRVVTKEPIIFLIFIQNLRDLLQELTTIL